MFVFPAPGSWRLVRKSRYRQSPPVRGQARNLSVEQASKIEPTTQRLPKCVHFNFVRTAALHAGWWKCCPTVSPPCAAGFRSVEGCCSSNKPISYYASSIMTFLRQISFSGIMGAKRAVTKETALFLKQVMFASNRLNVYVNDNNTFPINVYWITFTFVGLWDEKLKIKIFLKNFSLIEYHPR